jgi:hypothetical protein
VSGFNLRTCATSADANRQAPNKRLLLSGPRRFGRRRLSLFELVGGGLHWPRSRSAAR